MAAAGGSIPEETPAEVLRILSYYPIVVFGPSRVDDRDSCVVMVEQLGILDGWGMLQSVSSFPYIRARMLSSEQLLYKLNALETTTGRQHKAIWIMDMEHLSVDLRLSQGDFVAVMEHIARHYAEIVHRLFIVRASTTFQVILRLVLPLLPRKTAEKIHLLSYQDQLLDWIDPECLPRYYGGTLDTPDFPFTREQCLIPKSAYYRPSEDPLAALPHSKVSIPAGKTVWLRFPARTDHRGRRLLVRYQCTAKHSVGLYAAKEPAETHLDRMRPLNTYFRSLCGPPRPNSVQVHLNGEETVCLQLGNEHAWLLPITATYLFHLLPEQE